MGPSDYFLQSLFVSKKDRTSLRFVMDYTGLNKQILRPVHSFLSSQMVRNAIKPDTRVVGMLDFVQGYHQMSLAPESQDLTTFINSFGRFMFLRAPMGLSSSGDNFCSATDQFFSGLGSYLCKQVDDLLVLGTSWEDAKMKVRTVLEEA